jgi:hypothetical protein
MNSIVGASFPSVSYRVKAAVRDAPAVKSHRFPLAKNL